MAMATYLQLVTGAEMEALRKQPASINKLDQPDSYQTHFACELNFFLTGSAYPAAADHALAPVLFGMEIVACDTLECGNFGLVSTTDVPELAERLSALNLRKVRARIDAADVAELIADEELYGLEALSEDEITETLISELKDLIVFYQDAANKGCGIVSYTT